MNICEGCIKQDVCKFKERVEKEMEGRGIAEPLEVACKYKETYRPLCEPWVNPYPYDYLPRDNTTYPVAYPYSYPPQTTWTDSYNPYNSIYIGHTSPPCGKEEW